MSVDSGASKRIPLTHVSACAVVIFCICGIADQMLADPPNAIAVIDDAQNRVLLFSRVDGSYMSALDTGEASLSAPFDVATGPEIVHEETTYPDTLIATDLREDRVVALDAQSGAVIKTLINGVHARGLERQRDGRMLLASGASGVRRYQADGTFEQTLIAYEPVDGPANAWDALVRLGTGNEPVDDILVADPTLDAVFRFDADGEPLGVFAREPGFRFPEQLAARLNGNILLADPLADTVWEFDREGALLRTIAALRPRGVAELVSGNLLIAAEDGVHVYEQHTGQPLSTSHPGMPEAAPRMAQDLRCPHAYIVGDMNGDGLVNSFDIDGFVLALTFPHEYAETYPGQFADCAGDVNRDGVTNSFDIDGFVDLLVGG